MKTSKPGPSHTSSFTIGRLAKAADVGVETIRYYQRRGLLPVPKSTGSTRLYPALLIDRIAFIKRAQSLGFSLREVATLLDLQDGRNRRAVQLVASARLEQIQSKLSDLRRMRTVLGDLLERCQQGADTDSLFCPIIQTLAGRGGR